MTLTIRDNHQLKVVFKALHQPAESEKKTDANFRMFIRAIEALREIANIVYDESGEVQLYEVTHDVCDACGRDERSLRRDGDGDLIPATELKSAPAEWEMDGFSEWFRGKVKRLASHCQHPDEGKRAPLSTQEMEDLFGIADQMGIEFGED